MAERKEIIVLVLGYIIAVISPLIGLLYGAALFYLKKDNIFYNKQSRFLIVFSIFIWVVSFIITRLLGGIL